jgi:hypothetical protein
MAASEKKVPENFRKDVPKEFHLSAIGQADPTTSESLKARALAHEILSEVQGLLL